jgi:hypothetical protein
MGDDRLILKLTLKEIDYKRLTSIQLTHGKVQWEDCNDGTWLVCFLKLGEFLSSREIVSFSRTLFCGVKGHVGVVHPEGLLTNKIHPSELHPCRARARMFTKAVVIFLM